MWRREEKAVDALSGPAIPRLGGVLAFMRLPWAVDHGLQATSKRMLASSAEEMLLVLIRALGVDLDDLDDGD